MKFSKTTAILAGSVLFFIAVALFQFIPKQKQPLIERPKVTINGHTFTIEVASSSAEKTLGLSNRDSLAQDSGMLFLLGEPSYASFWMKDMHFPIDIIFINNDVIVSIAENAPPPPSQNADLPRYQPDQPSDKALEINAGLSKKYNIKKGDKIKIEL